MNNCDLEEIRTLVIQQVKTKLDDPTKWELSYYSIENFYCDLVSRDWKLQGRGHSIHILRRGVLYDTRVVIVDFEIIPEFSSIVKAKKWERYKKSVDKNCIKIARSMGLLKPWWKFW